MADERELIEERQKKVAEIRALGGNPYANGFVPTHTAAEILAKFAGVTPPPPPPGDDGKSGPAASERRRLRRGGTHRGLPVVRQDGLREAPGPQRADPGPDPQGSPRRGGLRALEEGGARRLHRRGRQPGHHEDRRADHRGRERADPDQGDAAAAREVSRPVGHRGPLPPALRRPGGEPRGARGVPQAERDRAQHSQLSGCPRVPRGGDADAARDRRRRRGQAVQDPPQRARPRSQHADRARAAPQAAGRRQLRPGLRDRPQLPQRGAVAPAQPRVHDAGVLPGLRDLRRPDGAHRDAVPRALPRDRRRRGDHLSGPEGQLRRRLAAHPDEGRHRHRLGRGSPSGGARAGGSRRRRRAVEVAGRKWAHRRQERARRGAAQGGVARRAGRRAVRLRR